MRKIVVTGKSIDEAVDSGLKQLNAAKDRVKIHVIEEPSKGLFGLIGSKEAKVELELIPDAVEEAERFLSDVFRVMDLQVAIDRQEGEQAVTLQLNGSELGILIGRRGQTLDSLQYLVNIVANRHADSRVRIILDAENFRERRKQTLEQFALRLADRVVKTRKEVVLEPMPPNERKIIHSKLQDHPKVKTVSIGEEPNRRVSIILK